MRLRSWVAALVAAMTVFSAMPRDAKAAPKTKFKVAISIYAGWMPWYYAWETGIVQKWAKSRGIEIEVLYMDYIPSVEAFVAEQVDACVMTNMEALDMPAASGIDSTALIVGDYSNGNDAVLTRGGLKVKDLKGQSIYLVELSVSHYLLTRCLEMEGLKEPQVTIVNTSDSDIGPAFLADEGQKAIVTWNPMVMNVLQTPGIANVCDSSKIPGEILDLMVVNTSVLRDDPKLGEALVGAWYEVLGIMNKRGPSADEAMTQMAKLAGATLTEYKAQVKTTAMFWTAADAAAYAKGNEIKQKMDFVRTFCFQHGLLGENAPNADVVGIQYPDGTIQGSKDNVKLRFDASFMEKAAQDQVSPD